MFSFPILLTLYAGFIHAFEADHLLGVGNIVSQRINTRTSLKDGISWGLGHASTLLLIGVVMICFKAGIAPAYFRYFEGVAGYMLIAVAFYRLFKFFKGRKFIVHKHSHDHPAGVHQHMHVHMRDGAKHAHGHSIAYAVGLIHGLAGSGALIIAAMLQSKSNIGGLMYLLIFGGGCIAGMMLAAGLFSIPFSKKVLQGRALQTCLVMISSMLCLLLGFKIIYNNLFV